MHSLALATVLVLASTAHAEPVREAHRLHLEVDPLPFARSGYGGQIGFRAAALPRLRVAIASFALDVPDFATQLDSNNDGFHLRVRPSGAIYVLYFVTGVRGGWVAGGSIRYLRLRYSHDDAPGMPTDLAEASMEAIVGYKYHPWEAGFYVQPWLALAVPLYSDAEAVVAGNEYHPSVVQPFATINLGWEFAL